jgi:hypothetical protein
VDSKESRQRIAALKKTGSCSLEKWVKSGVEKLAIHIKKGITNSEASRRPTSRQYVNHIATIVPNIRAVPISLAVR